MNIMNYHTNESRIRNYLGSASFGSGLICFLFGSTYDKLFGTLGFGGFLVYLWINCIIFCLIWGLKGIDVPEGFQIVVEAILSVAFCFISVGLDKLVPGKSDTLSIISYGLFALTSASSSRKSELGFETGFFAFFLSLFLGQLFKTNWKLLPIGLVFALAAFFLRHLSQSGSPNGDPPEEVGPVINATAPETVIDNPEYLDLEGQCPPRVAQDSGESLSSANNQENNSDESSQVTHHSPKISEGGTIDGSNEHNNEQEEDSSSPRRIRLHLRSNYGQVSEQNIPDGAKELNSEQKKDDLLLALASSYSSEQDHVSSPNYQNGHMHSPPASPGLRRRMTSASTSVSGMRSGPVGTWTPPRTQGTRIPPRTQGTRIPPRTQGMFPTTNTKFPSNPKRIFGPPKPS